MINYITDNNIMIRMIITIVGYEFKITVNGTIYIIYKQFQYKLIWQR